MKRVTATYPGEEIEVVFTGVEVTDSEGFRETVNVEIHRVEFFGVLVDHFTLPKVVINAIMGLQSEVEWENE